MKTEQDKARNRERKAEWYRENREIQYARVKANQQRVKQWVDDYRRQCKCSRCPETHPATLDFHHRDPMTKKANVSHIYLKGWSLRKVQEEIAKCDILCSNCHRKLHWKA